MRLLLSPNRRDYVCMYLEAQQESTEPSWLLCSENLAFGFPSSSFESFTPLTEFLSFLSYTCFLLITH